MITNETMNRHGLRALRHLEVPQGVNSEFLLIDNEAPGYASWRRPGGVLDIVLTFRLLWRIFITNPWKIASG